MQGDADSDCQSGIVAESEKELRSASLLQVVSKSTTASKPRKENKRTANYLFILSTGRTGSTSVTRMISSIPGFYIAGENGGIMNSFAKMREGIMKHSKIKKGFIVSKDWNPTGAWGHKPIVAEKLHSAVREYVKAIIGEVDTAAIHTIGFKEIRHWRPAELDEFMQVFPNARFIINTRRDLSAQLRSQTKNFKHSASEEKLRNATRSLEEWQSRHPDNSYLLRLEDFSINKYNDLLKWLGVVNCKFMSIAEANTDGYGGDGSKVIQCEDHH